jgi:flagellar motility protein MotE (MotC chaperone)
MSSRVRLLPALIGVAGVFFALRVGAMSSRAENVPAEANSVAEQHAGSAPEGSSAPAPGSTPAATPAQADASTPPDAGTHKVAEAAVPVPPAGGAAAGPPPPSVNQAQTKGEAEVLQNLGLRRAALDARERELGLREQMMAATERRVSEHLAQLKSLEAKLGEMLAQRDAAEEVQLASLVKTYENMKPAEAAKIFNKLDRQVMLSLAQRMKPAKIGGIMAAMEPSRAQDLTVMLALRLQLPKPQAAAPAAPAFEPAPTPTAEPPQASANPAETPHS